MIEGPPAHYLFLSGWLFTLGMFGLIWQRRNLMLLLLCLEMMLLAVNINFITFAHLHGNAVGSFFVIFILAIAASESAVMLAVFMVYFRKHRHLSMVNPILKG